MIRRSVYILSLIWIALTPASVAAKFDSVSPTVANEKRCLSCHEGIEQFTDDPMMLAIQRMARAYNDPGGSVICHGGNPTVSTKAAARRTRARHKSSPRPLVRSGGRRPW